jgi:hypothetical protein
VLQVKVNLPCQLKALLSWQSILATRVDVPLSNILPEEMSHRLPVEDEIMDACYGPS